MTATRTEYAARLASTDIFNLARSPREAAIWRLSIEHGIGWCDAEIAWLRRARPELSDSRTRDRSSQSSQIEKGVSDEVE